MKTQTGIKTRRIYSSLAADKKASISKILKTQNIIIKADVVAKSKAKFNLRVTGKKNQLIKQQKPGNYIRTEAFKKNFLAFCRNIRKKQQLPAIPVHKAVLKKLLSDHAFYQLHSMHEPRQKNYLAPVLKNDLNTVPLQFTVTLKKVLPQKDFEARLMSAFDFNNVNDFEKNNIKIHSVFTNYKKELYYTITLNTPLDFFNKDKLKLAKAINTLGDFKTTIPNQLPYKPGILPGNLHYDATSTKPCCCCCKINESENAIEDGERPIYSGVPNDLEWHLKQTRVLDAWKLIPPHGGKQKGEGIVIGHPDTGWRSHNDYKPGNESILTDKYFDIKENKKGINAMQHPYFPQVPPYFPTHGTATGSFMVSKVSGGKSIADHIPANKAEGTRSDVRISGVAPNASILPIRCVDGPVLIYDTNVQKAVEYAIDQKVHVISISLGGAPDRSLEDIINFAVTDKKNDIIVVASAGQYVDFFSPNNSVIEPAAYTNVIAAAGSTPSAEPWLDSCHGPDVDIVAPSKNVWIADFEPLDGKSKICWGEGTSFAAPQVAGIAALWLAFWGRDNLRLKYPHKPLAHVFKYIITKTAWKPRASWDSSQWGPGIIDAKAILNEPLPAEAEVPKPAKQGSNIFSGATTLEDWANQKIQEGFTYIADAWINFQNKGNALLDLLHVKENFEYWEDQASSYWALAEGAEKAAKDELNAMAEAAVRKAEEAVEEGEELLESISENGEETLEAIGELADSAGEVIDDGAEQVTDLVSNLWPW